MTTQNWTDVWVCTDCYFAHHYGSYAMMRSDDGSLDGPLSPDELTYLRYDAPERLVWFAGESDEPCGYEPLHLLEPTGAEAPMVTDNTCSNHDGSEAWDDDEENACTFCGQTGYENGVQDFSWQRCQGCGSALGGARYRLVIHDEEES